MSSCELHLEEVKYDNLRIGLHSQLSGVMHQREERKQSHERSELSHQASTSNQNTRLKNGTFPASRGQPCKSEAENPTIHPQVESQTSNISEPQHRLKPQKRNKMDKAEENNQTQCNLEHNLCS